MTEVVLLVDGPAGVWRPVILLRGQTSILERCHVTPTETQERLWVYHGERALTGQRIFREPPTPTRREPSEHPLFDELVLRTPIPLI